MIPRGSLRSAILLLPGPLQRSIVRSRSSEFPRPCKSSDYKLTDEAKKRFRHNVRGAFVGALRFDLSIERLVAKLTGKSADTVTEFFKTHGDFRRYHASLFLNCRDKPLSSYVFYSQHCRRAYVEALSMQEVSPAQMDPNQVRESWTQFTTMHSRYVEMALRFRVRYSLSAEANALETFRAKIVAGPSGGPSEKISRVFQMNPEELSRWLRKTAFTFCSEIPETDEGLEAEVRNVLMEVDDSTEGKWEELDPVGTVSLTAAKRMSPNMGAEDITVSKPMTEDEIQQEHDRAKQSVALSELTAKARAAEHEKMEQAMKKSKFEFRKIPDKKTTSTDDAPRSGSTAPAPGMARPVAPPTDVEMSAAMEAPIPDDEEDNMADTATDAPAPSAVSTEKSEVIIVGRNPEKGLGQRFFRASIVGSNVSSSMDSRAEDQLRREETGRNPDAAPSGTRRHQAREQDDRRPTTTPHKLPPPPPSPSGVERDRSGDPGYTARFRDDHGRVRLERREPTTAFVDLPAPPPVPSAPEAPEFYEMLEQQRRGRERATRGRGRGADAGKGKKGRGDGTGKGAEMRERTRTPPGR